MPFVKINSKNNTPCMEKGDGLVRPIIPFQS